MFDELRVVCSGWWFICSQAKLHATRYFSRQLHIYGIWQRSKVVQVCTASYSPHSRLIDTHMRHVPRTYLCKHSSTFIDGKYRLFLEWRISSQTCSTSLIVICQIFTKYRICVAIFISCVDKVTQVKEQEYPCKLNISTNYSLLGEYSLLGK